MSVYKFACVHARMCVCAQRETLHLLLGLSPCIIGGIRYFNDLSHFCLFFVELFFETSVHAVKYLREEKRSRRERGLHAGEGLTRTYTHSHIHVHVHLCVHIRIRIRIGVHTRTHTHTNIHVCTRLNHRNFVEF